MDPINSKETAPEHIDERHVDVDEKGSAPVYHDSKVISEEVAQATAAEHSLGLWQALKTYKRAAMWSVRK